MRARTLPLSLIALALAAPLDAGPAAAQASPDAEQPGIWIADASGALQEVAPARRSFLRTQDLGPGATRLVLSVETFAESATGALSAGRLAVARVRQAVSSSGVAVAGITSEVAYVEPRYRQRILAGSWETPRRLGFDAAHVITLTAGSAARLGEVIDAAMGAGATRVIDVMPETAAPPR
jgi:uncharacterized protein YggE